MNSPTGPHPSPWRRWLNLNVVGALLLLTALGISLSRVFSVQRELFDPKITYVRVAHWQLELGTREGLAAVIRDYEALHPGVRVLQMPVTERVYDQWTNTQMISGQAPDLIQIGKASLTQGDTSARFFIPLAEIADEPNPYNRGTALEGIPWRETFLDGMRSGFVDTFQDYFSAPSSLFPIRLFYNRRIVRDAQELMEHRLRRQGQPVPAWVAQREEPPSVEALFELCKVIRTMPTDKGVDQARAVLRQECRETGRPVPPWLDGPQPWQNVAQLEELSQALGRIATSGWRAAELRLIPIAGSGYNANMFVNRYAVPFTGALAEAADRDLDGQTTGRETYLAFVEGKWGFQSPAMRAYYQMLLDYSQHFPASGFYAIERDQMMHFFVMGRAGMMATGAWDAGGVFKQAEFGVGVMDFPLPDAQGRMAGLIRGRANEAGISGQIRFGVYKRSPHIKQAVDFLHYLTSQAANGKFNAIADWIPIVVGAELPPRMRPLLPDPRGFSQGLNFSYGKRKIIDSAYYGGLRQLLQGEISYEAAVRDGQKKPGFVERVADAMNDPINGGDLEVQEEYQTTVESCRNMERALAMHSTLALTGPDAADAQTKFRRTLLNQLQFNNGHVIQYEFEQARARKLKSEF